MRPAASLSFCLPGTYGGDRGQRSQGPPPAGLCAPGGVHQLLLAREVRVALRADFHRDLVRGGAGLEGVAARAAHLSRLVIRMDLRLHDAPAPCSGYADRRFPRTIES